MLIGRYTGSISFRQALARDVLCFMYLKIEVICVSHHKQVTLIPIQNEQQGTQTLILVLVRDTQKKMIDLFHQLKLQ